MTNTVQYPHTLTLVGDREMRVERIFNASRDRVWAAYTRPELVAQWWGRGNKVVVERFEPVTGGHWRFVEHAPDGTAGFEGRFREVTPQERISQTFEWDGMPGHVSIDDATFAKHAEATKLGCPVSKALGGVEITLDARLAR